jgi:hypothetical protein
MSTRTLSLALIAALAAGCASAPAPGRFGASPRPDPERWERTACLRGEYPVELDGTAYAQARAVDLAAHRQALSSPQATQHVLERRAAFQARCAAWLRAVSPGRSDLVAAPAAPAVTAAYSPAP